jgi:hypothetical protein
MSKLLTARRTRDRVRRAYRHPRRRKAPQKRSQEAIEAFEEDDDWRFYEMIDHELRRLWEMGLFSSEDV